MPTLVCVPIPVDDIERALADANQAKLLGADLVELRIDSYFSGSEGDEQDTRRVAELQGLITDCPLPVILTCRSAEEGGDYDGDEVDRVSLLEKLCVNTDHPPAYLDFELASYQKSANIRQKINLCVDHPKQAREVRTRLILSMHDFDGRPANLMRRLADAWSEPAASVVKFAYRARSIRDNLEIFEILSDAPRPTIGLGMGEFGLMSRVLAPKFSGFLTFASLRDEAATAPGQPTISDLLGMYHFRSIGKDTRLYGVIGWPVTQSMSPLIHNAGFEARGWDGVYLPMPFVADSSDPEVTKASFMTSTDLLFGSEDLHLAGASVTIPFKELAASDVGGVAFAEPDDAVIDIGACNTLVTGWHHEDQLNYVKQSNTDAAAIWKLVADALGEACGSSIAIIGAGGVASAAAYIFARACAKVSVYSRTFDRTKLLVDKVNSVDGSDASESQWVSAHHLEDIADSNADVYINCTPVGMTGGPDPEGLSIPVHELAGKLPPETVFFDTVYNPIETPMLKAAREYGFRTIDGVEMFVRQAAAQFELWTGEQAPVQLFDRLVREKLNAN
ncbi:MAG: type I 3-dehydroquinate dehydratase [Phycisphaera sp.]|nr:MAG: type I 3-dehydroquinate dehydratase [Phycisphaera sp.]